MVKINPDKKLVKKIKAAITANNGHCPCVLAKTPDTLCPCKDFRELRVCHCGLYIQE